MRSTTPVKSKNVTSNSQLLGSRISQMAQGEEVACNGLSNGSQIGDMSDLERRNGRNFALFCRIRYVWCNYVKVVEDRHTLSARKI